MGIEIQEPDSVVSFDGASVARGVFGVLRAAVSDVWHGVGRRRQMLS
jgi:hypothetical protein